VVTDISHMSIQSTEHKLIIFINDTTIVPVNYYFVVPNKKILMTLHYTLIFNDFLCGNDVNSY